MVNDQLQIGGINMVKENMGLQLLPAVVNVFERCSIKKAL
jgi:hypothetical protein